MRMKNLFIRIDTEQSGQARIVSRCPSFVKSLQRFGAAAGHRQVTSSSQRRVHPPEGFFIYANEIHFIRIDKEAAVKTAASLGEGIFYYWG